MGCSLPSPILIYAAPRPEIGYLVYVEKGLVVDFTNGIHNAVDHALVVMANIGTIEDLE